MTMPEDPFEPATMPTPVIDPDNLQRLNESDGYLAGVAIGKEDPPLRIKLLTAFTILCILLIMGAITLKVILWAI